MSHITGVFVLATVLIVAFGGESGAEDAKVLTCPEQLNEVTMQAHNLDETRDQIERALAKSQVAVYQLQHRINLLQKQLEDAKKATATPQVDEKKAE